MIEYTSCMANEERPTMTSATGPIVGPAQGETAPLYDLGVRFLIDGAQTGGRFSLVEHPLPARSLGSPIHTHHDEDEYSFVLEGRFGVQLGDGVLEGGPRAPPLE